MAEELICKANEQLEDLLLLSRDENDESQQQLTTTTTKKCFSGRGSCCSIGDGGDDDDVGGNKKNHCVSGISAGVIGSRTIIGGVVNKSRIPKLSVRNAGGGGTITSSSSMILDQVDCDDETRGVNQVSSASAAGRHRLSVIRPRLFDRVPSCSEYSENGSTSSWMRGGGVLGGTSGGGGGRKQGYVVHQCDNLRGRDGAAGDPGEYLTPTQRASRTIRQLKAQLKKLNEEVVRRRTEVSQLTQEIVKLRSFTAEDDDEDDEKSDSSTKKNKKKKKKKKRKKTTPSLKHLLPDLTCFNCGFVLTLTSPPASDATLSSPDASGGGCGGGLLSNLGRHTPAAVDDDDDDFFVSFEVVEGKLRDCEAEWGKKLAQAVADKSVEMEALRARHNDKVEDLLDKLEQSQNEQARLWQLVQENKDGPPKETMDSDVQTDVVIDTVELQVNQEGELERKDNEEQVKLKQDLEAALTELDKLKASADDDGADEPCDISSSLFMTCICAIILMCFGFLAYYSYGCWGQAMSSAKGSLVSVDAAKSLWILALRKSLREFTRDAETSSDDMAAPVPQGSKQEVKSKAMSAPMYDADVTLQFLKSAMFYFLTDRDNQSGHLKAIQSILNFSDKEKQKIDQVFHGIY
ncbi:unnamed protein product [Notodromas monacha]|uniref:GRIP domain-containing protein n=1 Tax=Notodromas monacha TaxID=399045 RepID=A0A7R9BIM8_9CRUS|nr:unnamed protein product [Notodromas monacha]CAG0916222.1 unnamed protein product [Notodromas monacha]